MLHSEHNLKKQVYKLTISIGFVVTGIILMIMSSKFLWWLMKFQKGVPIIKQPYFPLNVVLFLGAIICSVIVAFKCWQKIGHRFLSEAEVRAALGQKW